MPKLAHLLGILLLVIVTNSISAQTYTSYDGYQFTVSVRPEKETIMMAETTYLIFEVKNLSAMNLSFPDGGDYRNNLGRPQSFKVTVLGENGESVPQPEVTMSMGGLVGYQNVPANGSYVRKLFLPNWATFKKPGKYTITIERSLAIGDSSKKSIENIFKSDGQYVKTTASTSITVQDTDHEKLGMVISDIEDKVFLNKNDRTAADYIRLLDFIDDERTIDIWKRIVRDYASSDDVNITWNFQGSPRLLAKYDRSDVIPTLEVLMTSSNKDVRKDVANAFSISKDQRALSLLMKMRNDPYDSIRLTVAHRIRTIDTDETTQILTEMLRDPDDWVREAAERALAERDKMPKDVPLIPFSELSCAIRQTRAVSTMQGKDTPPKNDTGESNLFSSHNCEKALNAFTDELKMRRTTKDPFGEAWVLVQIGDIYTKGKRYELAYEYYLSALELFQQMGNDAEISLLDDIVGLSLELGRLNDALSYLNRLLVLSSSNKKESIRSDQGRILGRIAAVYNQLGDQSKRIEFLKRSISFNTPDGNKWEHAATLETLGSAYEKTGKDTEALASYRKALDVRLELAKEYDPNKFLGGNDDISRLRATIARLEE